MLYNMTHVITHFMLYNITQHMLCKITCYIDYFPIAHNTLCLPLKFCITYCLKMLLGKCNTPSSI